MATQTVWVFGDGSRSSTLSNSQHNAANAGNSSTDHFIYTGDVYDSGNAAEFTTFNNIYGSGSGGAGLLTARSAGTPGNHDAYSTPYSHQHELFWDGRGYTNYNTSRSGQFKHDYTFTINGWTFCNFDTAGTSTGAQTTESQSGIWTTARLANVDTVLGAAGRAKIIITHHGRYNACQGHPDQPGVQPLFQRCFNSNGTARVAAWLCGHNHALGSTVPVASDGTEAADEAHGVRFMTSAAGAGSFDGIKAKSTYPLFDWGVNGLYGYLKLTIPDMVSGVPQAITAQFYTTGSNGQAGSPTLQKTYTIDPNSGTTSSAPTVTVNAATALTNTSVTLNTTINPNGLATTGHFDYGTTTSYGSQVTLSPTPGSGTSGVALSEPVSGLTAGQTYHYRVVATNSAGTTTSGDNTFTTTGGQTSTGVLKIYGSGGGGSGSNTNTFQSESDNFKWNVARFGHDICESDGVNRTFVMRMNVTASYSNSTDSWGSWGGSGAIDRSIAIASQFPGVNMLLSINAASPTSADKVPKVTNGVMQSWKTQIKILLDKYAPGGSLGPGSVVTMQDGSHITLPSTWPGVLHFEVWNEPNRIGSCGGVLSGPPSQGSWGTGNAACEGRKGYDLVYIMNRDALNVAKAHPAWGSFKFSAITMGGLEYPYIDTIFQWGKGKGDINWADFDAVSMHCYYKTDPMTTAGGARGVLDTIRSNIRPVMASGGMTPASTKIWITEGGSGGSNSPVGSNTEVVNVYQGSGTANAKTDVFWGLDAHRGSGQLSQPMLIRNAVRKIRQMNSANNAGVEMYCPHMQFRYVLLDSGTAQSDGFVYWQRARCIVENTSADTNKNAYQAASGNPKRSPDWLEAGAWYHDEIMSETTTVNVAPDVAFTSPANGTQTTNNSIAVQWNATDSDGIATSEYAVDNGSGYGAWTAGTRGTTSGQTTHFSATVPIVTTLAGQVNKVKIRATDSNASPATSSTLVELTITGKSTPPADSTPPSVTFVSPSADTSVANGVTSQLVTATVYDDGTTSNNTGPNQDANLASCTINGVSVMPPDSTGVVSRTVSLSVGANPITIVARDLAGNTRTKSITVTRAPSSGDTTPPTLTVSTPGADASVSNATTTQTVTGQATDNTGIASVTVNGVAQTLDGSGNFTTSVNLSVGSNAITVIATDSGANSLTTTVTRTITRQGVTDVTAPTLTVTDPTNNLVVTGSDGDAVDYDGTVTDSQSGVASLTLNGVDVDLDPVTGAFSGQFLLNLGPNTLTFLATDNAGNQQTVTRTVTLIDDSGGGVDFLISSDLEALTLRFRQRGISG